MGTTFRVIDTETTGLDYSKDRVVEIAFADFVMHDATKMSGVAEFSSLVNPDIPIPPSASAIHHLVDADVADAPLIAELRSVFGPGADVFVAHNAEFDKSMLKIERSTWLCTKRLASHLFPDLESHGNQYLRYFFKLDVPGAKGLAAHRAMADVYVTSEIFRKLVETLADDSGPLGTTWRSGDMSKFVQLVDAPILETVIKFSKYKGQRWENVDAGMLNWIIKNQVGGPDALHTARYWLNRGRK